jgi:antitoxin MazE
MQVIRKIGKSKGIIIPKAYLDSVGLDEGAHVEIRVIGKEIIIKPAPHKYNLADLVAQMMPENTHPETPFGSDVGAEIVEYQSECNKGKKSG